MGPQGPGGTPLVPNAQSTCSPECPFKHVCSPGVEMEGSDEVIGPRQTLLRPENMRRGAQRVRLCDLEPQVPHL